MSSNYSISIVPATVGLGLLTAALYLQTEHAWQAGHFSSGDALAPAITVAVAVSGVLAHHRLASWRLASGLLFLVLSIAGSSSHTTYRAHGSPFWRRGRGDLRCLLSVLGSPKLVARLQRPSYPRS